MAKKRPFGRVRKLPSMRYQARYLGPDGIDRPAPETFRTKRDADDWLAQKQTEIGQGEWVDPDAGNVTFETFGRAWIDERPNLRPSTLQLYNSLFRLHLAPTFGRLPRRKSTSPPCVAGGRRALMLGSVNRRWRRATAYSGRS
ncbi:hypothetical protein ABIA33_007630 [Streptacidiphilus sp. MAP12-16]|uniref:hypothetical protein n=1 Tax=Streptacidiphilus sp. MAP12-16 TaxID=3156300 RepID=UPI003511DC92